MYTLGASGLLKVYYCAHYFSSRAGTRNRICTPHIRDIRDLFSSRGRGRDALATAGKMAALLPGLEEYGYAFFHDYYLILSASGLGFLL